LRYAFPSAASSRNKILAINVLLDPPNCLLLLSYGILTVTNPSDVLYKPVTVSRPPKHRAPAIPDRTD
jgi:hypothetical protein